MSDANSSPRVIVAIAGATGRLGKDVTEVFLSPRYSERFSKVIALVRDPSSTNAQSLAAKGAQLHRVSEDDALASFTKALQGVDVLVNLLPVPGTQPEMMDAAVDAAIKEGVKVYFPSEFGVDHREEFWGWNHPGWLAKHHHAERAREIGKGVLKVIEVYTGLFMELCFSPFFGFDHGKNVYTYVGSPDKKIAFTSKADIGRALAELSILALTSSNAVRVPDRLRICGSAISTEEARDIVQLVRKDFGVDSKIELKGEDLDAAVATARPLLDKPGTMFAPYIRIAIAQGLLDFSKNENELVNPRETIWKWKTLNDFVRENKGLA